MMARYNEILVGRFAQSIQKLFGVKGEVPVASLAGEVVVGHTFRSGRENRFLESWQTFGGTRAQGPVAAQDTVIRLSNPAGSNIIAVIESMKLFFSVGGPGEAVFEFAATGNNGTLSSTNTPVAFDARRTPPGTGNNQSAIFLSGVNNLGQGNHVIFDDIVLPNITMSNEQVNYDEQEIVLLPAADIQMRTITLNIGLVAIFRWRERFLEEPERA